MTPEFTLTKNAIIRLPFAGQNNLAQQKEVYFPYLAEFNTARIVSIAPLFTSGGAPLPANDTTEGNIIYENMTIAQLSYLHLNLWDEQVDKLVIRRLPIVSLIKEAPFITNSKLAFQPFGNLRIDWTKSFVKNTAPVVHAVNPLILQLRVNYID